MSNIAGRKTGVVGCAGLVVNRRYGRAVGWGEPRWIEARLTKFDDDGRFLGVPEEATRVPRTSPPHTGAARSRTTVRRRC
jgi:hypothetical protein